MKNFFLLAVLITILTVAHPALAQDGFGGCDESPENPTLILAGLASGAYAVSAVRTRMRAQRKSNDQRKSNKQ